MLQQHRNWYRTLAAALAVSAIAPATAAAVPAIDGQGVAAGGGPGVTPQSLTKSHTPPPMPDQLDRKAGWTPQASTPSPAATSDDGGGLDTEVWIAIGGAALVAAGGIGVAGRKRVQATKRQPA